MSKKTKLPADPHSEAALKWCVKNWSSVYFVANNKIPIICFFAAGHLVAAIDLRDIIKKRQPLIGIKKQVAGIVRGKRKAKR